MTIFSRLLNPFQNYACWLHTQWPSGVPEALPVTGRDGATEVAGIRIAGDLLGKPLLKFAADSGARAVQAFIDEKAFSSGNREELDLAIVGGGVAGLSAALTATGAGLNFKVFEASEPFSTIHNFTRQKPIFTYPQGMTPAGELTLTANSREQLLAELKHQAAEGGIEFEPARVDRIESAKGSLTVCFEDGSKIKAKRVLICTGKSGDQRQLGVPGEDLDKVHNRVFDPADYRDQDVLVVGGGDSALETASALANAGANTILSYRGNQFFRPKPENIAAAEKALGDNILYQSEVSQIGEESVHLSTPSGSVELDNDAVFVMTGREAPVAFLKRCGIHMAGTWNAAKVAGLMLTLAVVLGIYRWKTDNSETSDLFLENSWFPYNVDWSDWSQTDLFAKALLPHVGSPGFYYELLYTVIIIAFGWRRMVRNPTPYIRWQTLSLMAFQTVPLFLLPYLILPLLGEFGLFDSGVGAWFADQLFPIGWDGNREYWRSVGFILAWPLFIWNVFTPEPSLLWLVIALLQTFVLIPWLVYRYGKGAYCGWICSCGALAETLGDAHRHKMPHGKGWNRLNLAGQAILAFALALLVLRIGAWLFPDSGFGAFCATLFAQMAYEFKLLGVPLNYSAVVDYFLAGIIGLGLYFHFSGRVWCRFFCPLAALMHIYARFSQFRIFADKDKCISCNACTTACHQGIDIMNFANKGQPMEDPECVRCSACVSACPTGVLNFGRYSGNTAKLDSLPASVVQMTLKK